MLQFSFFVRPYSTKALRTEVLYLLTTNIAYGILLQKLVGVQPIRTLALRVRRKNLRSLLEVVLYSAVFSSVPCSVVQLQLTLQLNTQARAADPYLHSHLHIA